MSLLKTICLTTITLIANSGLIAQSQNINLNAKLQNKIINLDSINSLSSSLIKKNNYILENEQNKQKQEKYLFDILEGNIKIDTKQKLEYLLSTDSTFPSDLIETYSSELLKIAENSSTNIIKTLWNIPKNEFKKNPSFFVELSNFSKINTSSSFRDVPTSLIDKYSNQLLSIASSSKYSTHLSFSNIDSNLFKTYSSVYVKLAENASTKSYLSFKALNANLLSKHSDFILKISKLAKKTSHLYFEFFSDSILSESFLSDHSEELLSLEKKYPSLGGYLLSVFKEDVFNIDKIYGSYIKSIYSDSKNNQLSIFLYNKHDLFLKYPKELSKLAELSKENFFNVSLLMNDSLIKNDFSTLESIFEFSKNKSSLAFYYMPKKLLKSNPKLLISLAKEFKTNTYLVYEILTNEGSLKSHTNWSLEKSINFLTNLHKTFGIEYFNRYTSSSILENNLISLADSSDKPVALVFYNKNDYFQAYSEKNNISEIDSLSNHYKLFLYEVNKDIEVLNILKKISTNYSKPEVLIIGGHGSSFALSLGNTKTTDSLSFFNEVKLYNDLFLDLDDTLIFKEMELYLSDNALIFLNSCKNGEGESKSNNLANLISDYFPGRKIYSGKESFNSNSIKFIFNNKTQELSNIELFNGEKNILYRPDLHTHLNEKQNK